MMQVLFHFGMHMVRTAFLSDCMIPLLFGCTGWSSITVVTPNIGGAYFWSTELVMADPLTVSSGHF